MARRSKSSETTEKETISEEIEKDVTADVAESDDSVPDDPVVIEAEAVELGPDDVGDDSESIADTPVTPSEAPPTKERAGFLPVVFGGLIAGAIGFAAGILAPGILGSPDGDNVVSSITSNSEQIEALSARISEVQEAIPAPTDLSGIESGVSQAAVRVDGLEGKIAELGSDIAGLPELKSQFDAFSERLTALEIDEGNSTSAQAAAAEEQLAQFRDELAQMVANAEARVAAAEAKAAETEQEAAAAAAEAERQANLSELRAAIDSGSPFDEVLAKIENAPTSLSGIAVDGVPTMVALQRGFPDVARAALAASQNVPEDASTGTRLTAFLKRQTNARSLSPQDGSDANAVLSRAEASLSQGDLGRALSELSALPEEAQSEMSEWLAQAALRSTAMNAVDELSANMN